MATLFIEGFDKYGPINETNPTVSSLLIQGEWNSCAGVPSIVAPLSANGYAMKYNGLAVLSKTLPSAYSRLIGGFRFQVDGLSNNPNTVVLFLNGGTNVCTITLDQTAGTFSIWTGGYAGLGGTKIATSGSSITAGVTHYLEWDITFGASAAYHVYLDGNSILSGTGNTGNGQTTANVLQLASGSINTIFDDMYLFDSTGSVNNAPLLTSPRVVTSYPSSDSQTQWTNNGTMLGTNYSATASTNAPGANELFLIRFQSEVNQTINSVSCIPAATSVGAKFKAVIYSDSAGSPNTLLSSGNEVVGATSGTALTSSLVSPQSLTAASYYWVGFITDTSVALSETDSTINGQKAANTYGSGAPASAPAMTTGQPSWVIWGNCTGAATNWEAVNLDPQPGDYNSIASFTVGNEDLYAFPSLTGSVNVVYAVAVKANMRRSDTGARTVDLRLKSSGTDSGGTNTGQTPATSYSWLSTYLDTDPHTSAAWGVTALNAALAGPKVAS